MPHDAKHFAQMVYQITETDKGDNMAAALSVKNVYIFVQLKSKYTIYKSSLISIYRKFKIKQSTMLITDKLVMWRMSDVTTV